MSITYRIIEFTRSLLRDSIRTSLELFKVMVPIIVVLRLLQHYDCIKYLAMPLKPLMSIVGLPPEAGLAWAGALLNNVYTSLIIIVSLGNDMQLTQAQMTVLGTMILVAHAIPIEGAIAKKAGTKFIFQAVARIGGGFLFGLALHWIYSATGTLTAPAVIALTPKIEPNTTLLMGFAKELKNLGYIFIIITILMLMMRTLSALGVIDLLNRILRPILRFIGIGPTASAVTVIGLTLGLTYGSGLIIAEANAGNIDRKDLFYSITLMGMSHAMIEDTMLLMLVGAHFSGVFWGRLIFTLITVALLVKLANHLSDRFCDQYFWGPPRKPQGETA